MNSLAQRGAVVVICDRESPEVTAVQSYLASRGLEQAEWHAPRDVDDVDRAVTRGQAQRVVWPNLATWLEALWDGLMSPKNWHDAGVTQEFADASSETEPEYAERIAAAWEAWRARQRRRRAVAGVLLSVAALAAAFVVLLVGR